MPSVSVARIALALKAMLAMVIVGMVIVGATGVAVVGFANDYNFGSTGTPFPSAVLYRAVQFTPGFAARPRSESRHIRFDNADIQQLWSKPSPTLPLKISYAAPYTHSKPTPTPPPTTHKTMSAPASPFVSRVVAPSNGVLTLAISSAWYLIVLRYLIFALASSVRWVLIRRILCLVSLMATPAYLVPRPDLFRKCLQLPTKTKQILAKVTAIILVSFHNPGTLLSIGMYKARENGIPNLEFRRPRKAHADNPTAFCEQCLFATADIGPSFGPSIQNAETEFRSRLERVEGNIGRQADIVAFFRKTLDSFTRALAVAEGTPEGRNTRYLTVIEDQDKLIHELRMLHEYREQAFRGIEDLVESICQKDADGSLKIPDGKQQKYPFDKYSAEYDKFIISPPDSPVALSMNVSVPSAPFHRRPVTILDSDPYWQRFLESTAEKRSEQEARLVSHEDDPIKCDEREGDNAKDGCVQETCDVSKSSSDRYFDETKVRDDLEANDAESPNEDLESAKRSLAWFEWQLACMKSDSKQFSDIPPAATARVTDGDVYARQAKLDDWADCPKCLAINDCESHIAILKGNIACMKSQATSEGRPRKGKKGETLPEPTAAGESQLSRLRPKSNKRSKPQE